MKIRLAIVDDHNIIIEGLKMLFQHIEEVELINCFSDGDYFVNDLLKNTDNDPDVVLLDYHMPILNGLGVCTWLRQNRPNIKALIMSQYDDNHTIQKFIEKGASGYLLKSTTVEELKEAIIEVNKTHIYFNDLVSTSMLMNLVQERRIKPKFKFGAELSEREREIARLICLEYSYQDIADELKISRRTVEAHKSHILEKIGATKVTGIVVYATKKGWV